MKRLPYAEDRGCRSSRIMREFRSSKRRGDPELKRSEEGDEADGHYREILDMPADLRGARPAFPHHEGRVGLPSLQAGAEPAPLVPFQLFSLVRDAKRRLA